MQGLPKVKEKENRPNFKSLRSMILWREREELISCLRNFFLCSISIQVVLTKAGKTTIKNIQM